jgi:hypothetical protein
MGLGLSASTIKSWFQYRCERKTRYELMDAADRAAVPVIQDDREKPWAELGVDYEKRVLARLARRTRILVPGASEDGLGERIAAAFLRGEQAAEYAAQVNLRPRHTPPLLKDFRTYERRCLRARSRASIWSAPVRLWATRSAAILPASLPPRTTGVQPRPRKAVEGIGGEAGQLFRVV